MSNRSTGLPADAPHGSNSPSSDAEAVQAIATAAWRQGSVLPVPLVRTLPQGLGPTDFDAATGLFIVVSHSCDVTADSFEKEPVVELITARQIPVAGVDGSLTHGKNPRRFQWIDDTNQLAYEVRAHDVIQTDRRHLVGFEPDDARTINPRVGDELSMWLAKRRWRVAFPDEFNRRLIAVVERIHKLLKQRGDRLSGVYVVGADDELEGDAEYRLVLVATLPVGDFEDGHVRAASQAVVDGVAAQIASCEGIDVVEATLASEAEITLDDLRLMKRFDFDYLSWREDPPGPIAPGETDL